MGATALARGKRSPQKTLPELKRTKNSNLKNLFLATEIRDVDEEVTLPPRFFFVREEIFELAPPFDLSKKKQDKSGKYSSRDIFVLFSPTRGVKIDQTFLYHCVSSRTYEIQK